jgi:hypothetical protein
MRTPIRDHIRSNIIGYVALFLALTGSAYAVAIAPTNSVATRSIRDGAVTAPKLHNPSVTTAKFADSALAPRARVARNAQQLGGRTPAGYQRRVTESCAHDTAIKAIGPTGTVACASPVKPISMSLANGTDGSIPQPIHDLSVAASCNAGSTLVAFANAGPDPATLNWIYSDGTTVSATGTSLGTTVPANEADFVYDDKRIEGQFTFANSTGVTTVNLHAVDGNAAGCEIRGTAEFAASV